MGLWLCGAAEFQGTWSASLGVDLVVLSGTTAVTCYAEDPSGILDTCGFPKDSFYYLEAWWRDAPLLKLA